MTVVSARVVRVSKTVTEVTIKINDLPDVGVSHDEVKSEEVYLASLKGCNFGFKGFNFCDCLLQGSSK